jgi:hypothetical protein
MRLETETLPELEGDVLAAKWATRSKGAKRGTLHLADHRTRRTARPVEIFILRAGIGVLVIYILSPRTRHLVPIRRPWLRPSEGYLVTIRPKNARHSRIAAPRFSNLAFGEPHRRLTQWQEGSSIRHLNYPLFSLIHLLKCFKPSPPSAQPHTPS